MRADEKGLPMAVTTPWVSNSRPMSTRTLATFFIATCTLSWGVGVLLTVLPDQAGALSGPVGYTDPAFSTAELSGLLSLGLVC